MQNEIKPPAKLLYPLYTAEQIEVCYVQNYKLFCEMAQYFYKWNLAHYEQVYAPAIKKYDNKPPYIIHCPYCKNEIVPTMASSISTGGILTILAGVILTPVLVGIFLIFLGMGMKDVWKICPVCKIKL